MMVTPLPLSRKTPPSLVENEIAKQYQQQQPKTPTKSHALEVTEFSSGAKSPIKKHLKHAAMANWSTSNPASPSTRAQLQTQVTKAAPHKQTPTSPATTNGANMATMRASIIQVMLGLLDQEQATVEGTIPILQALASLPLKNPSVRHDCLQLLQRLHEASFSPSKFQHHHQRQQQRNGSGHDPRFDAASDIPTSEGDGDENVMPPSFVYEYDDNVSERLQASDLASARPTAFKKDSGRAKSLSLHHCKEFLLACANEIHELEDENPNFDYAEETSSETPRHHRRSSRDLNNLHDQSGSKGKGGSLKWRATEFDYVSTAASSASVATARGVGDDDDLQADQGSEFSEVVRRADYMSDFDDDLAFEPADHKASEWGARGLHSIRQVPSPSENPRELLNLQHRVFSALKQNKLQSRRNVLSKRLAFQNLKTNLRQMQLKRATMKNLWVATTSRVLRSPKAQVVAGSTVSTAMTVPVDRNARMKVFLSQQVDLVVVLLCAAFLHSMLS